MNEKNNGIINNSQNKNVINKNVFIVITVIIFIVISITGYNLYYKNNEVEEKIIGNHVKDTPFANTGSESINDIDRKRNIDEVDNTDENNIKNEQISINKVKIDKIKSYLRTFCNTYSDINLLVNSNHFKILKERVDDLEKNTGKFIYIELPAYTYEACKTKSPEYLETLILYLQTDENSIPEIKNKIDNTVLENYIKNLTLVEEGNIPKNIKNKDNFNNFFLKDQIEDLESFYYPYYVKEKDNISSFLNKPIFSLEGDNKNKEIALNKLILELKKLGINSLDEFKNLLLINNDFKDIEELKKSIILDYNNIISKNTELKDKLNNLGEYKSYLNTGGYKELFENNDFKNSINNLGKKMLIFSITNTDYADGLNETWSGKQFFGDEETGNGIIRLNFIYILTQ